MAYNENYAALIRKILQEKKILFEEKKMFGGIAFMINGKMACGITKDDLMIRILETKYTDALKNKDVREMDFTGRPMKGFLFVNENVFRNKKKLAGWIECGIEFVENLKIKSK